MTPKEQASFPSLLGHVVRQIAERFDPERVILFGSHARGDAGPDSDVDLLVVMETAESLASSAARVASAVDHPFPLDIVVRRPEALADAYRRGASFAVEVLTHGVVLYETGNDGVRAEG